MLSADDELAAFCSALLGRGSQEVEESIGASFDQRVADSVNLAEHGEGGVGLENLVENIHEFDVPISRSELTTIERLGARYGLAPGGWTDLHSLNVLEPSAGWYVDRADPSRMRYWNGSVWTDHMSPLRPHHSVHAARPSASPPRPPTRAVIAKTLAGLLAMSAVGVVVFGLFHGTADTQAVDDLGPGGRFALNFSFFLPLLVATVTVVPLALFGTLSFHRGWVQANVANGLAGLGGTLLATITLTNGSLLYVLPTAPDFAWPALASALSSLALTTLGVRLRNQT